MGLPDGHVTVFPAYAGMSPAVETPMSRPPCFPRLRGDEPPNYPPASSNGSFSPPTRG